MTKNGTSIHQHIPAFESKLASLNINELIIQDYPKDYLHLLLKHRKYYLHIYASVLNKLLQNSSKQPEEIVLLDYGAGNGLLGLFAASCGFKKVYINDYNSNFLEAANEVGKALQIKADAFIHGDCDTVLHFCETHEIPDAVVATDVIEHIYSLENFFACLRNINPFMISVFTTASIVANPYKNRQLTKLQFADENIGSNANHADRGDEFAGKPFIEIRKKIITANFPELNSDIVDQLSAATRGMNIKDIIATVERFENDGYLPQLPSHKTNTVNPITGSWTERLLTINEYESIYKREGFSLRVYNGFYNQWQGGLKGIALKYVNKAIVLLGRQGDFISPFILLVGRPV